MIETRSVVKLAQVGRQAQRLAQCFVNEQVATDKADLFACKFFPLDRVSLYVQDARDWLVAQKFRIRMRDARLGWQGQAQRVGASFGQVNG